MSVYIVGNRRQMRLRIAGTNPNSFFYEFVQKNTKHLKKSFGMPLYKGEKTMVSVWRHLTDTYQTLNLDTVSNTQNRASAGAGRLW